MPGRSLGSPPPTAAARARPGGGRLVSGVKTWISRLDEAAVFCVFFNDPAGRLTAAAIDVGSPSLPRTPIVPVGLSGWTWGKLRLDSVQIRGCDILARPDQGMRLLREHFSWYRPLVAATALGAAARVHDEVSTSVVTRRHDGRITDLRDNALITLGRTYALVNSALLAALNALRLAGNADSAAHMWGCAVEAVASGRLAPVDGRRTREIIHAVEARGLPEADQLAEAYRAECRSGQQALT